MKKGAVLKMPDNREESKTATECADVICCEKLTKLYHGGILAVDKMDLNVRHGEIFGLLGPNGAGKSTTVGMFTTLVVPTGGKAIVAGIDVVEHPTWVKQLIGVVSQTNNLDRALNVWENLYYHARFFGMGQKAAREAADNLLGEFRLTERAKADVMEISGGMARRLQVARALLHKPSVLFLDEPTAGLDPQSRLALWEILKRLHTEGQTILLTTHYMEEADAMCDRISIMDHGHILATDTPRNLKSSVGEGSIITVSASGDLDKLAGLLQQQIAEITRIQRVEGELHIQIKSTAGMLQKIVTVAEQADVKINDLGVSEPTLESVFISLTGKELRD